MDQDKFVNYKDYKSYPIEEMQNRSVEFLNDIQRRRTIRDFSNKPVPEEIIVNCLKSAGTAPSGANRQPWHFAVVSDSKTKKKIREAAEKEEKKFYSGRAPDEWLEALEPLGTDENKPFLEEAPYLIVIFSEAFFLYLFIVSSDNSDMYSSFFIACLRIVAK